MVETGIIIGVIMALAELVKKLGLPAKLVPIINLILGICFYLLLNPTRNIQLDIFNGLIIGLTASGLYSGAKNVIEEIRRE